MLLMDHHLSVKEEKNEKIKIRRGMGKNQKCCHCFLPLKIFVRHIYKQPFFTFYPQPFFFCRCDNFQSTDRLFVSSGTKCAFHFSIVLFTFFFTFEKRYDFSQAEIFLCNTTEPNLQPIRLLHCTLLSLNITFNARQPAPLPLG